MILLNQFILYLWLTMNSQKYNEASINLTISLLGFVKQDAEENYNRFLEIDK